MHPCSILVADDVPEICEMVAHMLEPLGHSVQPCTSGREALRLIKERRFDMLITDVLMPDGDGIELIAHAKKEAGEIRILAISGGGGSLESDYCVKLAKAMGAHATLMKPFDRARFLAAVEAAAA